MNELPKIVRARLQAQPAEVHPDADVLTAFYERALPDNERGPVLAHLAECSECRDVVGMALPAIEETQVRAVVPASAWGWPLMVRWGSLVACLVVVGAAVLIRHSGTPEVARQASEVGVMQQQDALADAAKDKAANSQPASAQDLRVDSQEQEQKAPVALTAKNAPSERAPVSPTKIEPAPAGAKKAEERAAKQKLDQPGTGYVTGGFRGALQNGNATSKAAPAPAMAKSDSIEMANAGSAGITPAPTADVKLGDIPGRAKAAAAAPGSANEADAPEQTGTIQADSFSKEAQVSPAGISASQIKMPAQFELSPEGQLRRSFDSGKTWEAVPVVERAKFNTLAVMGPEVWVGGDAGVLYHSADNGLQWKLMKPSIAGVSLTADIMNVRFTDMQHLAVITSSGQVWTTADGGQNWQRNR